VARTDKSGEVVNSAAGNKGKNDAESKAQQIDIPRSLSVRELADLLRVNSVQIIKQLMRSGIMANINQIVDYETATSVAAAFGFKASPKVVVDHKLTAEKSKTLRKLYKKGTDNLQLRPPVVTVMGHVDHGKTKLLDAIRQTNVVDKEAGGITQHIGAYQAVINGHKITFLDTPGHQAFTAMRAHGANITDITILVVAADDGVMPQTIEAINHARAAGVPIIVAVNKIDKANANPDLVKQQLADNGLMIEEWGGDVISVPISAKEKIGIPELLENVLLVAEMEDLKADPALPAAGVVIEAEMDKTRGPVATVLIQNGTLKEGDTVVIGTMWGRVRAMFNDKGKRFKKAEPSTPVEILGINGVPQVGDTLNVVNDEHEALTLIAKRREETERASALTAKSINLYNLYDQISAGKMKELNVILKADVQGSIEPIKVSLERLDTAEVKVRVIHSATGNVNESDVMLAIASEGLIIGFGVNAEENAKRLAAAKDVDIRFYRIIYNLVDDIEKALKGMLEPVYVEVVDGRAEVRAVFQANKGNKAAGVYVTDGKISRGASVRVRRGKEVIADSTVSSLKRFKDDVKEVATGYECGVGINDFTDFKVGDVLEFYRMEKQN
jgi:translation initiation factor IF-2